MKTVKLSHKESCPLWEFFRNNLPQTLEATRMGDGYGFTYGVKVIRNRPWYSLYSDEIASITKDTVELRYPEYFSDFEAICLAYEKQTGHSVTFKYWED